MVLLLVQHGNSEQFYTARAIRKRGLGFKNLHCSRTVGISILLIRTKRREKREASPRAGHRGQSWTEKLSYVLDVGIPPRLDNNIICKCHHCVLHLWYTLILYGLFQGAPSSSIY